MADQDLTHPAHHKALLESIDRIVTRLDQPTDPIDPAAWFLGPNAENAETLLKLVKTAVTQHAKAREDFQPNDPDFVDETERRSKPYIATSNELVTRLEKMMHELRGSIPLASYRNQSHMYWDITLPGAAGYLAGMLYNQNNVAVEASPVTTAFEISVARDLQRMLGFTIPPKGDTAAIAPWGHITCDGSVANIESMWAARNLKFHATAIARAIAREADLKAARDITVRLPTGERERLLALSDWSLLNLGVDEALALQARVVEDFGIDAGRLKAVLEAVNVQALGLLEFYRTHFGIHEMLPPVVLAPATAHYSWQKAAALLGIGIGAVHPVPVDQDGRMSVVALRKMLAGYLAKGQPVVQVVAVMGSTAESAVDPLTDILAVRQEFREQGMEFAIHADAAWGGYFASLLREPRKKPKAKVTDIFTKEPSVQMSDYVRRELGALPGADSVTLDPHKSGFIPYPAGALCYRNAQMPQLIALESPVVFHDGKAASVGVYGIEGSKPGAAAAAVHLSHKAIPTDRSGYGQLLGRCIFNAKRFYAALVTMPTAKDPFIVIPFNRLPAEAAGEPAPVIQAQIDLIRKTIVGFENDQLMEKLKPGTDLLTLFQKLGADLTVTNYAFNFRTAEGLNNDPHLMNKLNDTIFHHCSVETQAAGVLPDKDLFLTAAAFSPASFGDEFVARFAERAGVVPEKGLAMRNLISTMQNPWVTQTSRGNFLEKLMKVLHGVVTQSVAEVVERHGLEPFEPGR